MTKRILAIIFALIASITTIVLPAFGAQSNIMHNSGPNTSDNNKINVAMSSVSGTMYIFGQEIPYYDSWLGMDQIMDVGYAYEIPSALGNFTSYTYNDILHWNGVEYVDSYYAGFPTDNTTSSISMSVATSDINATTGNFTNTYTITGATPAVGFLGTIVVPSTEIDMLGNMLPLKIVAGNDPNVLINYQIDGQYVAIYRDGTRLRGAWLPADTVINGKTFNEYPYNQTRIHPNSWNGRVNNRDYDIVAYMFIGSVIAQCDEVDTLYVEVPYSTRFSYEFEADFYLGETSYDKESFLVPDFMTKYFNIVYGQNSGQQYVATITENGQYTWQGTYTGGTIYVDVDTQGNGSMLEITENGRYNVAGYNYVVVGVPRTINASSMFDWLIQVSTGFLSFEIAPNFTIGGILALVVGLSLIVWILKVFLGG